MEAGDKVKITKKWLNNLEEAKLTYTVLEINDKRARIQVNDSALRFVPIETVRIEHIEKI